MPEIRTILMTADAVGGVWTYAIDLCRELKSLGIEIILATMGPRPNEIQRGQARALGNVRLEETDYKLEWMEEPWGGVARAGEWLLDLARRERPDIVHLNGYAHGNLPWPAPVVMVGHSCVCSWWQSVKGEPAPRQWDRYRTMLRDGLRAADLVVTPSHAMRSALRRHYDPIPWAMVVHNGRDASLYQPAEVKEPLVLSAGRMWDEAKNLAALQAAAAGLPWPVFVAGAGRDSDRQRSDVHVLGQLSANELASWLGRAAIYALPAKYEPFGLSALEAALSGCALILGDIDSLREIWGDAAAFVPPDDSTKLRDTIRGLIDSPSDREELIRRATARARRYTTKRMAMGYMAAYREAIAQQKPKARSTRRAVLVKRSKPVLAKGRLA